MGSQCSICDMQSARKKAHQSTQDTDEESKTELLIGNHRKVFLSSNRNGNLSVVPEDAYESQISYQNSQKGLQTMIASQSLVINADLSSYWVLDIQDRYVLASITSNPSRIIRFTFIFDDQSNSFQFLEAPRIKESLNSSMNQGKLKLDGFNPFEKQVREIHETSFNRRKTDKIPDFPSGGIANHDTVIGEIWENFLLGIYKELQIEPQSNLIIINNILRFSKHSQKLKSLCEHLLSTVFQKLQCGRFTLCSSGPAVLKNQKLKTGIVFDISQAGFVYCFLVNDGYAQDEMSSIIYYPIQLEQSSEKARLVRNFTEDLNYFLGNLKPEKTFFLQCYSTKSIVINNFSDSEYISSEIYYIIEQTREKFAELQPEDILLSSPQFLSPVSPSTQANARLAGTIELLKLNVIETISKSRFDLVGPQEIVQSNLFI